MTTKAAATAAVIGAGPAGLMAAEALSAAGVQVDVYDAMPSVGRKFLLAGKGGLNLTHSESADSFLSRYAGRRTQLEPFVAQFDGAQVREWAKGLGVETFVGTSGRVFPKDMKAAPLLRAWLHRLRNPQDAALPVRFHMRHRWLGWDEAGALLLQSPQGEVAVRPDATLLALGGASWPRLGSDATWVPLLQARGVAIAPLQSANCGFDVQGGWSAYFADRFAGQPFKGVGLKFVSADGQTFERKGEFVATATGVEGSLIYAVSALLRDSINAAGSATFSLDLRPELSAERVLAEVSHPRGSRSLANHLKSRLKLDGIALALLHERLGTAGMADDQLLARTVKSLEVTVSAPRPVAEAISTAGGVSFEALDDSLMVRSLPGVYCAGEMLDWEAPTGGYLLTACMATGKAAGLAAAKALTGNCADNGLNA